MKGLFWLTTVVFMLTGSRSFAQKIETAGIFKPAALFADHMILQRDHVIAVYGTSRADEGAAGHSSRYFGNQGFVCLAAIYKSKFN